MSYNEMCCNIKDAEIARLRASHAELLAAAKAVRPYTENLSRCIVSVLGAPNTVQDALTKLDKAIANAEKHGPEIETMARGFDGRGSD